MAGNFYDGTEAELYTGSGLFNTRIGLSPPAYGLTAPQAAAYADLNATFADAYQIAIDPATRTQGTVASKNAAKAALKAEARTLAAIIQAMPSVTAQMLLDLGLHVRKQRASVPRPSVRPAVDIRSVVGRQMMLHIHDSESETRRGKPAGAVGAWVYTFVGEDYPADPSLWDFDGATNKAVHEIEFPSTLPGGTKVWVCAAWINAKNEAGPTSVPISTNLQGGGSNPVELKMAA